MVQLLSVVLAFILTGLIGNAVVQKWQHRAWIRQQQFLGREKEYLALRDLSTELANAIAKRLYRTRRLLWAIRSQSDEIVEERLKEYDCSLVEWNENLSAFYVRLTLFATYWDRYGLEERIHQPLQRAGAELEQYVRLRREKLPVPRAKLASLENRLTSLQAQTLNFTRDILREVERVRERVYFGTKVPYNVHNLQKFSTWQLIKSLFVSRVDTHSVFRSSSDSL